MPQIDFQAALRDGYTPTQIIDGMRKSGLLDDVDIDAARTDGYSDYSILTGLASRFAANTEKPEDGGHIGSGIASAISSGIGNVIRSGKATGYALTGDNTNIERLAGEAQAADKERPIEAQQFMQDYQRRIKQSKLDDGELGWLEAIGDFAAAAWDNKTGTVQTIAEQLPNAVPVLAAGWAGGKAGAVGGGLAGTAVSPGPGTAIGAVAGGVIGAFTGMFLGNAMLETGNKAMEKAEGGLTDEERQAAISEGTTKGAVIAGVDLSTLGLGGAAMKAIAKPAIKAGAMAEAKVLADAGVDVANPAAVVKALENAELKAAAQAAGNAAARGALSIGRKAAMGGTGLALETVGEGAGEYLGEMAATGKGDVSEAVLEGMMGLGQSSIETAYNFGKATARKGILAAMPEDPTDSAAPILNPNIQTVDEAIAAAESVVNAPIQSTQPSGADDAIMAADELLAEPVTAGAPMAGAPIQDALSEALARSPADESPVEPKAGLSQEPLHTPIQTGAVAKTGVDTGLIVTSSGKPYKTEAGASYALKSKGEEFAATHQVVAHPSGGFAISRTQPTESNNGISSPAQPIDTGRSGVPVGNVSDNGAGSLAVPGELAAGTEVGAGVPEAVAIPSQATQQPSGVVAAEAQRTKTQGNKPPRNDLAGFVQDNGGVHISNIQTISGESTKQKAGKSGLFMEDGKDIAYMTRLAADHGFPIDTTNADGGVEAFRELLGRAASGEEILTLGAMEDKLAEEERKAHNDRIRNRARELGMRTVGRKMSDLERAVIAAEEELAKRQEKMDAWTFEAYSELVAQAEAEFGAEAAAAMIEAIADNEIAPAYGKLLDEVRRMRSEQTTGATKESAGVQAEQGIASKAGQDDASAAQGRDGDGGTENHGERNEEGFSLKSEGQNRPTLTEEQQAEASNQALLKRQVNTDAVRNAGLQTQSQEKTEGATSQGDMFTADGRATVAAETSSAQAGNVKQADQSKQSTTGKSREYNNGLADIYVTLKLIDEDGTVVKWNGRPDENPGKVKADMAMNEVDARIDKLKQLLDCLG